MKLLYDSSGNIIVAVYDVDWFKFKHSINIPISTFEIDEVAPDNKEVCYDLSRSVHKKDINGLGKYYIESGELHERDGWVEVIDNG